MKTSCKFATSPDILVAKGENSVANVTVLVAIPSPVWYILNGIKSKVFACKQKGGCPLKNK